MFIIKNNFLLLLVVLCVLGLVGCAQTTSSSAANSEPVEVRSDKTASYKNIAPEVAKKRLDTEKGIILLDVRTIEEYTEKHIPGSMLIPVEVIEKEASGKLKDKNAVIFIYCRSGNRSATAARALVKIGYTNVYNLGGLNNWPYDIETGASK